VTSNDETPRPPATPEFAHVAAGGPAFVYPSQAGVEVRKLSVGTFDNNVYLLMAGDEAVLIDGAAEPERLLAEAAPYRVTAILQTHNHPDHTGALRALKRAWPEVPVFAHEQDPPPVPFESLDGGVTMRLGPADILVIHTPGHTPGSLCYLVGTHLFTGDTMFPGGPGNSGRDPKRFERIMQSLDGLFELPDETRVSPGHGLDTTIGRERPYVQTWRRRGW
jgi:glyoxylase-like metal-dependent hydrolase (beta-lactamase superfamily II)